MRFMIIAGFADSLLNFRGALIDALLSKGHEVHVVAPDVYKNHSVRQILEQKGIFVHEIPLVRTGMNPVEDIKTFYKLFQLMLRIRPEHVFAYTIKPAIYGTLAAYCAAVPKRTVLITGLGYAFQGSSGDRTLLRFIAQRLYGVALNKSTCIFFQNPDDQQLFYDADILRSDRTSIVVNGSGIDVSEFSASEIPDKKVFLMIARLLGDKGVREYAGAAAIVKEKFPEAEFHLVGWIDDNPDAIKQHELDDWINEGTIKYLGKLTDVRSAIKECTVYVLPSYREGTPRTVLEAMAMGRAIITSDAPGCRETVINELNGYLVPVKSVVDLADAMLNFLHNDSKAHLMGTQSRRMAEDKYDVNKVNEHMLRHMGVN